MRLLKSFALTVQQQIYRKRGAKRGLRIPGQTIRTEPAMVKWSPDPQQKSTVSELLRDGAFSLIIGLPLLCIQDFDMADQNITVLQRMLFR